MNKDILGTVAFIAWEAVTFFVPVLALTAALLGCFFIMAL